MVFGIGCVPNVAGEGCGAIPLRAPKFRYSPKIVKLNFEWEVRRAAV